VPASSLPAEYQHFAKNGSQQGSWAANNPWRARQIPSLLAQFKAKGTDYLLIILHSLHAQNEMLETIRLTFTWMIFVGLLLAGTGGYFLAKKSLAPVVAMGSHARRIGSNKLA